METRDRIFIQNKAPGPRLTYTAGFLSDSLGLDFIVIQEKSVSGPLIIYGNNPEIPGVRIPESGFLSEKGIRHYVPTVEIINYPRIFPVPGDFDLPFDIFSAIFYFLSRYEEYLPFEADSFGRFELKQCFAWKNGLHQEPLVDQWLIMLSGLLRQRFPGLKFPHKKFRSVSTFDIDSPWAFKHRRAGRNLPGLARDILQGKTGDLTRRLQVLRNAAEDPFDVYSFIRQTEDQYHFKSLFFFLLANHGRIDPNHSLHSGAFENLIRGLSLDHDTGIHPSFHSNQDNSKLEREISRFRLLTGKAPENSRQHYLMLKFPETYQRLINYGIKDDYSMGFASGLGFRAGTTLPFRFYDLEAEKQTGLTVHPFAVMDVTLMQYMQLNAEQAIDSITGLIDKVRTVNGVFISLWHNESLSEFGLWIGWRRVFIEMVRSTVY